MTVEGQTQVASVPDEARPATPAVGEITVIRPSSSWVPINLMELWRFRELIGILALRDIKVRYAQSILGAAWAVLQPLMTMAVFNVLFGLLMGQTGKPTIEGIPYAVCTYCALVPWQLFARGMVSSGDSLVANQHLITKVYFPRLVVPIAPILAALVDSGIAFIVLIGMMLFYGIVPGPAILLLPVLVLLAVATALSVSLWLSALNALYRDVRHTLPFLSQLWMFVTPVVYTTASVMKDQPDWVRIVYGLNPMAGVVEGFRWALLGAPSPPWLVVTTSFLVMSIVLVGGLYFFRRMERVFADLV
ncbi:ABC transporter permease [Planctomycetota bacterium]